MRARAGSEEVARWERRERVVRWQGGKDRRVVKWQGGRFMLIVLANSQRSRGASHHPTFTRVCPVYLVKERCCFAGIYFSLEGRSAVKGEKVMSWEGGKGV